MLFLLICCRLFVYGVFWFAYHNACASIEENDSCQKWAQLSLSVECAIESISSQSLGYNIRDIQYQVLPLLPNYLFEVKRQCCSIFKPNSNVFFFQFYCSSLSNILEFKTNSISFCSLNFDYISLCCNISIELSLICCRLFEILCFFVLWRYAFLKLVEYASGVFYSICQCAMLINWSETPFLFDV